VDADDHAYDWLSLNADTWQATVKGEPKSIKIQDAMYQTWSDLFDRKTFTPSVSAYLKAWHSKFDFFGDQPFFQVTESEYDHFVSEKKRVATGTGTVALKQIDRRVSESAHSPAIFAPKAGTAKNELKLPELIRWVISYQNYTGVTDKSKVVTADKYSASPGWLYKLNPVFAQGDDLFETLMLNLVLVHPDDVKHTRRYAHNNRNGNGIQTLTISNIVNNSSNQRTWQSYTRPGHVCCIFSGMTIFSRQSLVQACRLLITTMPLSNR
jgi:CRISPR system Cascade subunit CasA